MALAYLGLGSNLGDRRANLTSALRRLSELPDSTLLQSAGIYETPPVGGPAGQGMFLNSACLVKTSLTPQEFLREIHAIERALGRLREQEAVRWSARTMDIDILFWDDSVIDTAELTVPHPRAAERLFVLLPLAELNEDLRHPVLQTTIKELLNKRDGSHEGIRRLPL